MTGTPIAPPSFDKLREVRLAVVINGGVSLAIYMNGVAQELLHLVRASAPSGTEGTERDQALPEDELTGSERVYRKLAQLGEDDQRHPSEIDPGDPILTQFVIDVLSGTSAGGINAIYLAKALANRQSMDELSHLWIQEGDIAKLLNDRRSARDVDLPTPRPPRSLLNSQRMYLKLLDAFDGMDRVDPAGPSGEKRLSPYADELDLYVTTTDLRGLLLPVPLDGGGGRYAVRSADVRAAHRDREGPRRRRSRASRESRPRRRPRDDARSGCRTGRADASRRHRTGRSGGRWPQSKSQSVSDFDGCRSRADAPCRLA